LLQTGLFSEKPIPRASWPAGKSARRTQRSVKLQNQALNGRSSTNDNPGVGRGVCLNMTTGRLRSRPPGKYYPPATASFATSLGTEGAPTVRSRTKFGNANTAWCVPPL
jgi:hypothetical protein